MTQYYICLIVISLILSQMSPNVLWAEGELKIKTGKYKLTKTTKTNFDTEAATRSAEECITDPDLDPQSILPNRETCKIENLIATENRTSFHFICTEPGKSSSLKGQAEYSVNGDTISSNIRLEGVSQGKELVVESKGSGEWIGECPAEPILEE